MNLYLMKVRKWFGDYDEFEIEAENKSQALEKGRVHVLQNPKFGWGTHNTNDVVCVKKLRQKKKAIQN